MPPPKRPPSKFGCGGLAFWGTFPLAIFTILVALQHPQGVSSEAPLEILWVYPLLFISHVGGGIAFFQGPAQNRWFGLGAIALAWSAFASLSFV